MAHYYDPKTREARHFVPKKSGAGQRPTTITDARANGWVPSVTTILKVLAKPQLQDWITKQAVHAVVTAPDVPGEGLDAKIERILEKERQQDEEARSAADLGTRIHAVLENMLRPATEFQDKIYDPSLGITLSPYVMPVFNQIRQHGQTMHCEKILTGPGYGGMTDYIQEESPFVHIVWDFKSSKRIPREPYLEHRFQIAAYAHAWQQENQQATIKARICYISTTEPGKFEMHELLDWHREYVFGFTPVLKLWQYMNGY